MSFTSRRVTRIAFGVIIVFVLAQVFWWIIFQERYVSSVTKATLAQWARDADTATLVLERTPGFELELLESYPHLMLNDEADALVINPEARVAFLSEQRSTLRMFSYEGPFFILVVLAGLAIIAKSLRSERELKRRQQNFLSAVTHEFKTPLSTLRLLVETALMRTLPPEKQRDYLQRMESELSRLEQTSEQVLASARLENAKGAVALEPHDLNSVVQGLVGSARAGLEARGAVLDVQYSPEALPVSLDAAALGVVLNNLLDNAVKYSPEAKKPVRVWLESTRDLVRLHVEDRGIGIGDKERKQIFERFYRVGSEMTRSSKGVGLGLHLVKSITEAMNGWVQVEALPQGTRFSVVFPKRVAASLTLQEART